jgi:hypothetical protein
VIGRGRASAIRDPLRSSAVDTRALAVNRATDGLKREDLLVLADLTLADYFHYLARYGGESVEQDGLLLFAGAHPQPNPYRNGVLRLDASLPADEVLRRAERFFAPRKRSYALWVREHGDRDLESTARTAGLRELERLPELVMHDLPAYLPPPDGVELRRATDARAREDYLALVANAWGMAAMPRDVAARVFFDPDSLDDPSVVAFVAYYDHLPVSAAMTLVTQDVALGCQAATIRKPQKGQRLPRSGPPGERRSLAESCLWAALEHSYTKLGARLSLGQTSSLGAPAWLQLGYGTFTSYARYVVPMRPANAARV